MAEKYLDTLLKPTPLINLNLPGLPSIYIKDESSRLNRNSFKSIGCLYAVAKTIAPASQNIHNVKEYVKDKSIILVTASDGNHGLALAWAGSYFGVSTIVFIPQGVSEIRKLDIEKAGATVFQTKLSYDETCEVAAKKATENKWTLIQDTAWDGYEKIPRLIMDGYAIIAKEVMEVIQPTHIFLQVGVGSFAAAIAEAVYRKYTDIKIISVEPYHSACLYHSLEAGKPIQVKSQIPTICQGLDCGTVSSIAWDILKDRVNTGIRIEDNAAVQGKLILKQHNINSGESGAAATLGAILCMTDNEKNNLGMSASSKLLIFNTEGPIE